MNETKYFPTPNEVHAFPKAVMIGIEYVSDKLKRHEFNFKADYGIQRVYQEMKSLLNDCGWALTKDVDNNWKIEPKK